MLQQKTKPVSQKKLLDKIAQLETKIVEFETKMRGWGGIMGDLQSHFASIDKVQGLEDEVLNLQETLLKINYRLIGIVENKIKRQTKRR